MRGYSGIGKAQTIYGNAVSHIPIPIEKREGLLMGFDLNEWIYASHIASNRRVDIFTALNMASKRICGLRKRIYNKYPNYNPAEIEICDKEYYIQLLRMISKA